MNRRSFLAVLGGSVAAMALDPERALWVPGQKTFFLPSERRIEPATSVAIDSSGMSKGDIFTIDGVFALNPVTRRPTRHLQQFVVTADVSGYSLAVAQIAPRPVQRGEYANVTGWPSGVDGFSKAKAAPLFTGRVMAMAVAS